MVATPVVGNTRIVVFEDTDPLVTLRLKKKISDGKTDPYPLSGSPTIAFVVKASPDASAILFSYTGAAITVVSDGTGVGETYSEIGVQFTAADIVVPDVLYWYLKVTTSGKADVVDNGYLEVRNI